MHRLSRRQLLRGVGALGLGAVGAGALAACAVTPQAVTETVAPGEAVATEGVASPPPGEETFVLEVYHPVNARFQIFAERELFPKLKETFAGASVYFRPLDWSRINEMLMSSKATGTLPDLFFMGSGFVPIAAHNELSLVLDELLDEWGQREDFYEAALVNCQWDGKTWGLPQQSGPRVYSYRGDIAEESGVQIPADWTWDDYLTAAAGMTVIEGNRIVRQGSVAWMDTQEWMGTVMSYGTTERVGMIVKGGKAAFNGDAGLWALEWIKARKEAVAPEGYAPLPQSPIPYIATGQVAMGYAEGDNVATQVKQYAPDKLQHMVVQQPPLKNRRIAIANTNWLALASTSKHKDAAWELLKLFMEPDALIAWNESIGLLPPRKSAAEVAEYLSQPTTQQVLKVFETQSVLYGMLPPSVTWAEWDAIMRPNIEAACLGQKTPEQALVDAERDVNELFAGTDWDM